tara:strand:- start:21486 stop:24578 length:3093 start_codon:yes stop_codon:yes gene_type:complete
MSKNKNWFIESTVEAGEVIINDGGSAVDFRIEGDTDSNLLVTDGSADKVGIGTNSPDTKLHITSDTIGELLSVSNHNVSSTMPVEMVLKKSRGSKIAPATIADGDELGKISFDGYDGSNYDELAHITVKSTSVSSDTSSMTFHSDKFILDTGTLQFGTTGDYSAAVKGIHPSTVTLDGSSTDDYLVTAKTLYSNLSFASLSSISWSSPGSYIDSVPRLDTSTTLTASNIYSNGASGNVSIGADTTDEQSEKFKLTGSSAFIGALTVGVNDTGHDVKLFGATSGKYMLWDESADSLILGVDDTGVDFIAHGATASKKVHWDESADSLLIHGGAELGHADGDVLKVHGGFKLYDVNAIFNIKAASSSQAGDIFQVYDKNDALSLSVENEGDVEIKQNLKFTNKSKENIVSDSLSIGVNGAISVIDMDNGMTGGKSFALNRGTVTHFSVDAAQAINLIGTSVSARGTSEIKLKSAAVKINSYADAATAGVLEVAKITTSAGNLTLDSAGGTVSVADHLSIAGDLTVTGAADFAGTTSSSFSIDTGGNNLGFKSISLTAHADNTTTGLAVNKWLHVTDSSGTTGSAGLITENIHTEAASMTISTKQSGGLIVLSPGHNYDSGTVSIGTSAAKQANLICYGNASVSGDLSVTGDITGGAAFTGTSSATFQIDNGGNGPKLHVGSDDLLQTVNDDGSTLEQIHTTGILLDSVKGASTNMSFKSYNGYMKMQPGTNANTSRYLWLEGSIKIRSMGALTYNYIGGSNKIGSESHGSFGTTDDLAAGDTKIYMDSGELFFDASENIASFRTSDLIFGATDASGNNSTDGNQVKFYGNNTSAYMQWLQSSNKLILNGQGVGADVLNVKSGNAQFGVSGEDKCDVKFNGTAGEILDIDSGESYAKFTQGVRKTPNVYSATQLLTKQMSGRPIVVKNKSADSLYTLPAAANGLNYKFMITERTGSYDVAIVTPSQTNFFFGSVLHIDTDNSQAVVSSDNNSNNKLNMELLEPGSMIEVTCDGTNWYISGYAVSTETPVFSDV